MSQRHRDDSYDTRLARLERQLRSARLVAGACLGITMLAIALGLCSANQSTPKDAAPSVELPVLEVSGIILKDRAGKKSAMLGFNPNNQYPGLYLFDEREKIVGEFCVADGRTPEVILKNGEGKWRYRLSLGIDVNTPTQAFLASNDQSGVKLVEMGIGQKLKPFFRMMDRDGKLLFEK